MYGIEHPDHTGSSANPHAPWNLPDAVDLDECPAQFDGDCHNPECDSCHCVNAPACQCDHAYGTCDGWTTCDAAGQCECEDYDRLEASRED